MEKTFLFVSILFLLLIPSISAQNNFSISVGGGYLYSAIDKAKLPYWENGFIIALNSDYRLTDQFSAFISTSYQQYFFDQNLVTFAVPRVVGYGYNLTGENSSVFEFSIGTKLFAISGSRIKPYFGLGVGVLFIDQGKVEITDWIEGYSERTTNLFSNTGQKFSTGQINLGLGVEIELVNHISLLIDGKYVQGFDGFSYIPITSSIKVGL